MDVYVYQAALLCEDCGRNKRLELRMIKHEALLLVADSDRYPEGPYADGGGEADSPQYCDTCHTFLENPLTSDGYDYVRETLFNFGWQSALSTDLALEQLNAKRADLETWAEFYDCLIPDPDAARFDRFDICLAHYVFACEYYTDYSEQCKTLQRLARMQYKPGLTDSSRRMLENSQENENALNILARLVRNEKATEVQHA